MATDRTKEIDIVDMKEVSLGLGVEPRPGRMLVYPNNGTVRFRDDTLQTRSFVPNSTMIIVGVGGEYPDLVTAIAAAPAGSRLRLMPGTYAGHIVCTKKVHIEGEGYTSIINGNLTFNAGSDQSYVTNCNIRGNITFNAPTKWVNTVLNWISSTTVVTDNNVVTSVDALYRLFALVSHSFEYYAQANAVQQTFAEFTGNVSTHATVAGVYDTYARIAPTVDTAASSNITVSTYASAAAVFSAFARATRVSNTFAIGDTTYQVRATGTTQYNVRAVANTTYSTRATAATTSDTLAIGASTFSTHAFGNYNGVTFTAVELGVIGNTINLIFDGIEDIDTVVANWNGANGANQVTHNGTGTDVLPAGNVNLFAGSAGNAVNFSAVTPGLIGNGISLTFDGITDTLQSVVDAWNLANGANQVTHDGNPGGVPPATTVILAGGSGGNAVTITAVTPGISGNTISIPFDGTTDLATTIANWNAGNPASTVTYTGIPTSIVAVGNLNLAGAVAGVAVTFTAVTPGAAGNSISLVFNGTNTIDAVVTAWNGANGANQVSHNGVGTGVVANSTVNLSGGVTNATSNFSANTLGVIGNSISLTFNGTTDTLTSVTTAWNGANAGNTVAFTGNGAGIPPAATINLTGGVDTTAVRFQSTNSGTIGNTITLVFNGIQTIQTVVANWNGANPTKPVSTTGPNAGVVPAGNLTLTGGRNAASYTLTADTIGATGNLISIAFDGVNTLAFFINDWNTNNPTNTVTNTGVGTDVLTAQTITLSGGVTDAAVTFTADNLGPTGNTISLVFNGVQDIATVVNAWNAGNATNTVSHNGNPLGRVASSTVNLAGAAAGVPTKIVAVTPGTNGNLITLNFNGTTDTVTNVIAAWNASNPANTAAVYAGGVAGGVPPIGVVTLTGGANNVAFTFIADNLGVIGNLIVLPFDGGATMTEVVDDWNAANPTNTVTATGPGTSVLPDADITLVGGLDDVPFHFFATNTGLAGNTIVLIADGVTDLDTIIATWNGANPGNTAGHDAVTGLGVPTGATYTLVNGSLATAVYFKATFAGVAGNAITLTFDGILSIAQAMEVWNLANPGNTVGTTALQSLVVAAQVINLIGGAIGAVVVFTATNPGVAGNAISLVMNGIEDVDTVTTRWNTANPANTVGYVGNPTGVVAASTIVLTGGRPSVAVTFTADNLGTIGNAISLVFNGAQSFNQVVNAWNTANPTNTVSHNAVDGTYVPYAITLNPAGGLDDTIVTFSSTGGPGFTLIFDGTKTIKEVTDNWNLLNPSSQVAYSGRPGSEPGIIAASIVRLAIGGAANMFILTQE